MAEHGAAPYNAHKDRLRYESRPRAAEALRRIAAEPSSHAALTAESPSSEDSGIHQGFNVILQYMDQRISGDTKRGKFADFLRRKVTVIRVDLPRQTDVNRYFEIMNTRGQQLQQVDIVKARLMSYLDNEAERGCFAWIWDACADMDSYVQMSLTRGDTGQRKKIFSENWSWLTVTSFQQLLGTRDPAGADSATNASTGSPLTLDGALAKYAAAGPPSATGDPDNERFRSTIEFPVFLLHVLKVKNRDDEEQEGHLDDKRLIRRFGKAPGGRVTYTSPRTMHWITKLLKLLTESKPGTVSEARLAGELRNYARRKVSEAFFAGEEPTGFSISRVVFTYLDYLLLTDMPNSEFRFAFRNSIEHFYPQHPDEQQSGAAVADQYLNLLGNLALVSVGANSKFSNSLPKAKAENFRFTIETQSPKLQKMAGITRRQDQGWDDAHLLDHHHAMVDRLRDDLGL